MEYSVKIKKCHFPVFFLLRLFAALPKYRFTETGELVTVWTRSESDGLKFFWMQGEGYAGYTGVMFVSCPRSLKIEYLKRYVGGLVVFDDLADAYRVPRDFVVRRDFDDGIESFTVCGFLFLWKHEHMNC